MGARRRPAAAHNSLPDREVHRHETPGRPGRVLPDYETREGSRDVPRDPGPCTREANIDFHHIAAAYDAIEEWFGEQAERRSERAIDLHTALSKWVYVIWYEAPEGTNPNDLFTRLNRDRIPLTDSELIKALVLSNSGAARAAEPPGGDRRAVGRLRAGPPDEQFWAFLTGSTKRPTHIDFLFESMTPRGPAGSAPVLDLREGPRDIERARRGGVLARCCRAARTADRVVPRPRCSTTGSATSSRSATRCRT